MTWNYEYMADILRHIAQNVDSLRKSASWELKTDGSLVTQVDKQNEKELRNILTADGSFFIGEETVDSMGQAYVEDALNGQTFVVDPIDGTAPFAHGLPLWAISIGFMNKGILENGAVILPDLHECLITNGNKVLYTDDTSLSAEKWNWTNLTPPEDTWSKGGMVALGQNFTKNNTLPLKNPVLASGSAVQALSCLLTRRAIAYIGHMKLWDIAAMLPMLERLGFRTRLFNGLTVSTNITNGAFNLDLSSDNPWCLTDSMTCALPGITAKLLQSIGK